MSVDSVVATAIQYDAKGNIISISLSDAQSLHYQYDLADRLISIENELGETIEFTLDADGIRISEVTQAADQSIVRIQRRVFDELSRLIESLGAADQSTQSYYDKNDNLVGMTDALGRPISMRFDGLNRLIGTTDALRGTSTYTYDARDNLIEVIDASGIATQYQSDLQLR